MAASLNNTNRCFKKLKSVNNAEDDFWCLWILNRDHMQRKCIHWMQGNIHDAEDAMTRAVIKGVQKYPIYAPVIKNPIAWLVQLTRNVCMDIWRENSRYNNIMIGGLLDDQQEGIESFIDTPEDLIGCDQIEEKMDLAMRRISKKIQKTYQLRIINGWCYNDIAKIENITEENARKRVQKAKSELRRALVSITAENNYHKSSSISSS